ncbi:MULTISPECIES: hypothetical protein [Clostridium]|uniref:Uncharacterized protein n=2 Tax=Clostridium TaxID=1485 RepID=A0A151AQ15_9CLOT|nr:MULTISPECIES: hypothetical protein [Clostridium]KYH29731.1 hypothetical protein CLCOL_03690 [Clostridium colicanis DSM 13634]MBE6044720.1 hypothetical protein [Clostridium thermopalmarium]PRR75112.1 hypothetical protein CPAL_06640 [Clostridium thermopalmarium DSM 5974]PVZ27868.1 hypothetical protein LX19_00407 [Clostridium thermopalmarium DSM 5974]
MAEKKIEVSLKNMNNLINELIKIKFSCYDENIRNSIESLIEFINVDILNNKDIKERLLDQIHDKMVEVKTINEDLNASLYILYQELKNDRISIQEAVDRFEVILKTTEYM